MVEIVCQHLNFHANSEQKRNSFLLLQSPWDTLYVFLGMQTKTEHIWMTCPASTWNLVPGYK